ncbi:MAG: hypothetical protein RBS56_02295 [Candidatus Gracilibacteria bacterium]|nr:hypothetical protein [Candidatus Gracilibacteria bacterium]
MKSLITVAFFGFVSFNMVSCEDHVRVGVRLSGGESEQEDENENEEFDQVEELDEVDGSCVQVFKGANSPRSAVIPQNAKDLFLLNIWLVTYEEISISGLVFEQYGVGSDNKGVLRISETGQEVKQEGRKATFLFEQDLLTVKNGTISMSLKTDLDGSMLSGDVLGYRLIEVLTSDGDCIEGLPVEGDLMSISVLCPWVMGMALELGELAFYGGTFGCRADVEVREHRFSVENNTSGVIRNFRLENLGTGTLISGPVDLPRGKSSFSLNDPLIILGGKGVNFSIKFDAEPGEVKISLDSVVVWDLETSQETFSEGDLPFYWWSYKGKVFPFLLIPGLFGPRLE